MRYSNKVTLVILAVVAVFGVLLALNHWKAESLVFKLIQEKVFAIAVSAAPLIDGDAHERITEAGHDGNEDYLKVQKVLREVRDANRDGDLPVAFVYTYRPLDTAQTTWEYVVDAEEVSSENKSAIGEPVELEGYGGHLLPELDVSSVDTKFITDSYGTWLSAWAPIKNSKGEAVALLGVDIAADKVVAQRRNLFFGGLVALALTIVAAGAAAAFLSAKLSAPLHALRRQVGLIQQGDLVTRIPIESQDEFGELGDAIHQMADGLQERESFKEALVRFVSAGKTDSVIEGSATPGSKDGARRVTVLTASLKGLENVKGSQPVDEVFGFLSDWYSTMVDVILQHRGSLEKSAAETVTATFGAPLNDPNQERHALEAALTIQQAITGLRRRWKIPESAKLSIESSIHTGHITITDQDDFHVMDVASLQRIIGAASLIRDTDKTAGNGIVISEATADGLKGTIPLNYLKSIEVPGTGEMLAMHTVQMPSPS